MCQRILKTLLKYLCCEVYMLIICKYEAFVLLSLITDAFYIKKVPRPEITVNNIYGEE